MKDYLETWSRPSRPPFKGTCLIWGWPESVIGPLNKPTGPNSYELKGHQVYSLRAGGHYVLWQRAKPLVDELSEQQKARLTTWLIEQREQGDHSPEISRESLNYAIHRPNLQVHERAERLLKHIAGLSNSIGAGVDIRQDTPSPYAWSESTRWEEVVYLLNYLRDSGWLDHTGSNNRILANVGLTQGVVTVDGFNQIAVLVSAVDSTQAFVAMWFNSEMDQVYDQGIRPAVESAGFRPFRADREHFLGKIDDRVIAEIRRSRFLIADMTHGEKGARGSVYFEAGFAYGLNLPVIYTCRKDILEILHFDTRQYPHLDWTNDTIETFRQNLEDKIRATIV
ncbi:MAG: hypothetical protein OXF76_04130 [Caldilineaceae bacterium]|nr:hypothetical protein [Caldilineaceae bacterium]